MTDLTHGEAVPLLVPQEVVLHLGGPEVLLVGAGHHQAAIRGEECLEAVTRAGVETVQLPPDKKGASVRSRDQC